MLETACAASKSRSSAATWLRMAFSVSTSVWWSVMLGIVRSSPQGSSWLARRFLTESFGSVRSYLQRGAEASVTTTAAIGRVRRGVRMVQVDPKVMEAAQADLEGRGVDVVRLGYSD